MKKIWALLAGIIVPFCVYSGTAYGIYKSKNPKEISISIVGKDKVVHPDKKGRFTLKDVNVGKDTMQIISPQFSFAIKMPLAHPMGAEYPCSYIITEVDSVAKIDFCYKPNPPSYPTMYGGTIIKKEELESTGEQNVLAAVQIKYPQNSYSTLLGTTTPLFFVDGVETFDISHYPVREIAYVEYVKPTNAASASLGYRGANGAILLTTMTKYITSRGYVNEPEEKHIIISERVGRENEMNKNEEIEE